MQALPSCNRLALACLAVQVYLRTIPICLQFNWWGPKPSREEVLLRLLALGAQLHHFSPKARSRGHCGKSL